MENEAEMNNTNLSQLDALFELAEIVSHPNLPQWINQHFHDLSTLRAILMDPHPPQVLVEDGTLKSFGSIGRDLESRIYKFDVNKMDINMAHQMIVALVPVLSVTSFSWKHLRSIFGKWKKPSRGDYPKTDPHGFIDHFLEYLGQVMQMKAKVDDNSIGPLKLYILRIQGMLQWVRDFLLELQLKKNADLKYLVKEIANLAYETEYTIDASLVKEIPVWYGVFCLQDIQYELNMKIEQINTEYGEVQTIISDILDPSQSEEKINATAHNTEISETLDTIFRATIDNFDICTWCSLSSYKENKKEVFVELIHNTSFFTPYIDYLNEYELAELVQALLKDKHYFIVLKEVCSIEDLIDIKRVLPDNGRGNCRILVTSVSPWLFANISTAQPHTKPTLETDVVGFKVETQKMLNLCTMGSTNMHIITVFGRAGQGKTTFAKSLYNHELIANYFDRRAWGCVSQGYSKRKLLLELLGHFVQLSDTICLKLNNHELAVLLWQNLLGYRFLIVLDDIWSAGAWNDIRRCFPDNKNGSRIIFTTRLQEFASEVHPGSVLQTLGRLSDDESLTLLQYKLFQDVKKGFPRKLLGFGKQIAEHCKGLPLLLVSTAEILKKLEKCEDKWRLFAENLSRRTLDDTNALDASYDHLPEYLRPCFLYFGAFLEKSKIPVQKLIRLWIAEGFIKHSDSKSLEEVAEDYLVDLIKRSLVFVAQQKSTGGVKSCSVNDNLLREFLLIKMTKENFLQHMQLSDVQLDSDPITFNRRRHCINFERNHFLDLRAQPIGSVVRSLFLSSSDMSNFYDISFNVRIFKLLRILNFEDINIGNTLEEITVLLHLRYLAVQCAIVSVPSSIANILNLETFCVKSLEDKVVEVPDDIWNLSRLRHLHITGHPSFNMEPHRLENSSMLNNLQTLSTPSISYGDDTEKLLRKLKGIRKLKCKFLDSWNDLINCNQFPMLEFMAKLESIKVFYNGGRRYPCMFNFPSNLKKLTLTNFHMPWSEISQLLQLCNLEVLKLLENSFEGEIWLMEEDEVFPKLKVLKLDSLNFVQWVATEDNFPGLERLLMHKCEQLEGIPLSLGDIAPLGMIEVKWCNSYVAFSAKQIQEERLEYEDVFFELNVHPKLW